jgi:hypothetical protein
MPFVALITRNGNGMTKQNLAVGRFPVRDQVLHRWQPGNCRRRQISEYHCRLIGTGLSTGIAYLIRKGARRRATDFVGVETVVPGGNDQRTIAINVDPTRSRAAPRQVRSAFPTYQVTLRSQCDLGRCRRRRSSCGSRSCRSWARGDRSCRGSCSCCRWCGGGRSRRCWSWACGREPEFADARKPAGAAGDRIIFVGVPES